MEFSLNISLLENSVFIYIILLLIFFLRLYWEVEPDKRAVGLQVFRPSVWKSACKIMPVVCPEAITMAFDFDFV